MPDRTRLLLTSVMRPLGPHYGDADSVGYELMHAQITRAQGLFSPRAVHKQFSLDYLAENLENPTVVLHYPSRKELIAELKKGYDFIGISFIVVTYHRMKEIVALVRRYSPGTKIILGGYGTVLPDEALRPWSDYICRGEGVSFLRQLLGQAPLERHRHPVLESRLKVFSKTISYTGMIFAGLGCPNGCDFCSTSHFFRRQHLRLLSTGTEVYEVVKRHLEINADAQFTILDEEFLLDRRRAMEFRDRVMEGGKPLSIFVFASIKALSLYRPQELLEMGVDGVWIGYEGERSGYDKRAGKSVAELFEDLKQNGIMILASMIIGFDYHTPEIIDRELATLLAMKPDLCQFMIYNPNPGTPLYDRVVAGDLLRPEYREDPALYWKKASGFKSLLKHPQMSAAEIEAAQQRCYRNDFLALGPSIYRVVETMLNGYRRHKDSTEPFLRKKALRYAREIRNGYGVFFPGELLGPNRKSRDGVRQLKKRVHRELGASGFLDKVTSWGALAAALWTGIKLQMHWFQNPKLERHTYRLPPEGFIPVWLKERFTEEWDNLSVKAYEHPSRRRLLVRLEGVFERTHSEPLAERLRTYLEETRGKLLLDLAKVKSMEEDAVKEFCTLLGDYRSRIKVSLPISATVRATQLLFLTEIFKIYKG